MSAILGFTELACDEALPPHVLDWLGTVRESADHLLALLNEILDFSRIESRRFELDPVPFSPREVVEETVRSLGPPAPTAKGLELTGSVGRGVPDALTGDPVRLRQILTNLAGNAVKFTDRGRVAVRIERDGTAAATCRARSAGDRRVRAVAPHRAGHRPRHRRRGPRTRLPTLRPGGQHRHPQARRDRAGAVHHAPPGRA